MIPRRMLLASGIAAIAALVMPPSVASLVPPAPLPTPEPCLMFWLRDISGDIVGIACYDPNTKEWDEKYITEPQDGLLYIKVEQFTLREWL